MIFLQMPQEDLSSVISTPIKVLWTYPLSFEKEKHSFTPHLIPKKYHTILYHLPVGLHLQSIIHLYPCLYKKLWVIPHSTMLWKIKWVVLKVIYWEALGGDINGSTCWNINQTMPSLGTKHSYPPPGSHIKWCEECLPACCLQEKIYMLPPPGFLSSLGGTSCLRLKKSIHGLKQSPWAYFKS